MGSCVKKRWNRVTGLALVGHAFISFDEHFFGDWSDGLEKWSGAKCKSGAD
jgi:hypothetical protein